MKHRLYKVYIGRGDGLYGRYACKDGISLWLSKNDADGCIASGIGIRKSGPPAPYYAILEIEAVSGDIPRAENACVNGGWKFPSNGVLILSTEAQREGIVKNPNIATPIPVVEPVVEPVKTSARKPA